MPFQVRGTTVAGEETTNPTVSVETELPATPEVEMEPPAVEEAMRVIQKHIDKEARNRWVEHLEVRDLCPRQKADLISELARLF